MVTKCVIKDKIHLSFTDTQNHIIHILYRCPVGFTRSQAAVSVSAQIPTDGTSLQNQLLYADMPTDMPTRQAPP